MQKFTGIEPRKNNDSIFLNIGIENWLKWGIHISIDGDKSLLVARLDGKY